MLFLEVLTQDTWNDLKDLEDMELKESAGRLSEMIIHSYVDSTLKKYMGAFRRWKVLASQYGMLSLPAKDYQIALYLQSLGEQSQSRLAVEVCNALVWIHSTVELHAYSHLLKLHWRERNGCWQDQQ